MRPTLSALRDQGLHCVNIVLFINYLTSKSLFATTLEERHSKNKRENVLFAKQIFVVILATDLRVTTELCVVATEKHCKPAE